MKKRPLTTEIHYLTCLNPECVGYACLARRDYESQLDDKEARICDLEEALQSIVYHANQGCSGHDNAAIAHKVLTRKDKKP